MKKNYLLLFFTFFAALFHAQEYKMPIVSVTSQQPAQSGADAYYAIDGNVATTYHSKWGQVGIPDQLDFVFSNAVQSIKTLKYIPRTAGLNGVWTSVDFYYSTQSAPTVFTKINSTPVLWALDNTAKSYDLPTPVANPAVIRIVINAGGGNFSSCAEMEFYSGTPPVVIMPDCAMPTSEFAAYNDTKIVPSVDGSSASSFQPGENIENSFDGDMNTLYHSNWNAGAEIFPVTLIYKFDGQTPMDYLKYYPRPSASNGNFGNVKISYNTLQDSNYVLLATQDFGMNNNVKTVNFPSQITPLTIKIEVLDGYNNFASCAEMEFYSKNPNTFNPAQYSSIFTDGMFTTLQPSVTQASIDAMTSPFFKALAQCILNNTYDKSFRIHDFKSYKPISTINRDYKIANYSAFENPTGIVFAADTNAVIFAKNISANHKVYLKVRDFETETSTVESQYELKNGLNVLPIKNRGLGYISYYNDDPTAPVISLNITAGLVNGVFRTGVTTSTEWKGMLNNGFYKKIDIEGHYTEMLVDKFPLLTYAYESAQPLIDKYDIISKSQREMMGFFKFNKNFDTKIFAYTESRGGWYAGGMGAHFDLTWGLPNSTSATGLDYWGVSHELGHINQVRPGIRWIGMTEITNNLYSTWDYFNLYTPTGSNRFTRLEYENGSGEATNFPVIAGNRYGEMLKVTAVNKQNIQTITSDRNFRGLIPFWQLVMFYQIAGAGKGAPELVFDTNMTDEPANPATPPYTGVDYAHWLGTVAEKVIHTDETALSQGDLVMNFVKNVSDAVQQDLTDYFTNVGFLRPINQTIDDYTPANLTITQAMIDQTIAYVKSKNYEKPSSPVLHYISAHSLNVYKNNLPLSGTTGVGAALQTSGTDTFVVIDNSKWANAVAFETYDASNALTQVSIVGTGDTSLAKTYAYFPSGSASVYAVGYDGTKILVYPTSALATLEASTAGKFGAYPNPVKNGENLVLKLDGAKGKYTAEIYNMAGSLSGKYSGTIEQINARISSGIGALSKGGYIITLYNDTEKYHTKIIKN